MFKTLVNFFINLINQGIFVIIGVIVLIVIFKIVRGISKSDSKDGRTELRKSALFGIIGITIALSFWAIVKILANSFNLI